MAGHLVGLKLALLRNGLRRSNWPQQVALALGALAGLPLAFGGFLLLALVPRAEPGAGLLLVEVVFLLLFLGWGLFPLLSFAGDASLDPSRLALLPLRPRELVAGLSLAACVGVAPLCTLVALGGAVVGFGTLGPGLVLVVAAVLVQFALCIVGSRALLTALSRQLRSRKARDLVIVLISVTALGLNLALQVGARLAERLERADLEALRPLARVLGWLPTGLAARALVDAGEGRLLPAVVELAGAALAVALLGWWWWRSLDRVLTTAEPAARQRSRQSPGLFPRPLRRLLPPTSGARSPPRSCATWPGTRGCGSPGWSAACWALPLWCSWPPPRGCTSPGWCSGRWPWPSWPARTASTSSGSTAPPTGPTWSPGPTRGATWPAGTWPRW